MYDSPLQKVKKVAREKERKRERKRENL